MNFSILDILTALFITVIADKCSTLQNKKSQLIAKNFTDNIYTGDIFT